MEKQKIFILLSRFPYPLIKGDKLRAFHQIRMLSADYDVHLTTLTDEKIKEEWTDALKPYCSSFQVYRLSKLPMLLNIIKIFIFSKLPVQTAYFYNKRIDRKIRKRIEKIQPDILYCQLIRTALYARSVSGIPKYLDYMDALSAGMERRCEAASKFTRWIFRMEANRLKRFEHRVLDEFDGATVISESDRDLIFHYGNEKIKVVPNGIDTDYFKRKDKEIKYDLLFTGNMSYPPNVQSALFLVEEIMPLIREKRPGTSLLIAGANPVQRIRSLESEHTAILPWLEDIRDAYSSARIFIAPMLIGSGLQNKLLEAMSMNLACITSELANRSLGAEENSDILIGRSAEDYANKVLKLIQDENYTRSISEKGHSFVTQNFSWKSSNEILKELFENE